MNFLLHRLTARNFKQLTDVTLHFPSSGTILIEGHNEAGKSTLFEAVYFALYGKPLQSEQRLEDLKRWNTEEMTVELEFSIGSRPFTVQRRVATNQRVQLDYRDADGVPRTVRAAREVRAQLEAELCLSADALRNTCFVEQKDLGRLETLDASQRRATINELLNLRVLTLLEQEFRITLEDRQEGERQRARVGIAELDAALPARQAEARRAWRCWRYALVLELEQQWQQRQEEIEQIARRQQAIQEQRATLAGALAECDRLRNCIQGITNTLLLLARAWQTETERQKTAEQRLEELRQLEAALPAREQQQEEWEMQADQLHRLEMLEAEAEQLQGRLQNAQEALEQHDTLQHEWEAGKRQADDLKQELEKSEAAQQAAQDRWDKRQVANQRSAQLELLHNEIETCQQAQAEAKKLEPQITEAEACEAALPALQRRLALTDWLEAAERLDEADPYSGKLAELEQEQQQMEARYQTAGEALQRATRTLALGGALLLAGLGIVIVAAVSQVIGSTWYLIGVLAGGAGVAGVGLAGRGWQMRRNAGQEQTELRRAADTLLGSLRALQASATAFATQRESRAQREAECRGVLEKLGETRPQNVAEARARLSQLPPVSLPDTLRQPFAQTSTVEAIPFTPEQLRELIAQAAAKARQKATLQAALSEKTRHAAQAADQAKKRARDLALAGLTLSEWAAKVQREREQIREAIQLTPDAALREALEAAQQRVKARNEALVRLQEAQEQRRKQLDARSRQEMAVEVQTLEAALAQNADALQPLRTTRQRLREQHLPDTTQTLRLELAKRRERMQRDREEAAQLPATEQEQETHRQAALEHQEELRRSWQRLLPQEPFPDTPDAALQALPSLRQTYQDQLNAQNEPELRQKDAELAGESDRNGKRVAGLQEQQKMAHGQRTELLSELELEPDAAPEERLRRCPELAFAGERSAAEWEVIHEKTQETVRNNRSDRRAQADPIGVSAEPLELADEKRALEEIERRIAVKRRAGEIVQATRQTIVSRVMPLTMQNMRRVLPLLTEGRYQDVEWDEEKNAIAVYDSAARAFQRKNVFSGGARDQISLALRLAFALATLPGEQNVRPGWLFLDEPLSSFDRPRTLALVQLLTRGLIRQQFAQIVLISHSEAFDPGLFDYRLRLENGSVAESSLASPPALSNPGA